MRQLEVQKRVSPTAGTIGYAYKMSAISMLGKKKDPDLSANRGLSLAAGLGFETSQRGVITPIFEGC